MMASLSEFVDMTKKYGPKRIAVAEGADILLADALEAANLLRKSMAYIGHAACAGIILRAKVPLVIVARGSTPASRLQAIAFGVVVASAGNNEQSV